MANLVKSFSDFEKVACSYTDCFMSYMQPGTSVKDAQDPLVGIFKNALRFRNHLLNFERGNRDMERIDQKLKEAVQLLPPHFYIAIDPKTHKFSLIERKASQKMENEDKQDEGRLSQNLIEILNYHCGEATRAPGAEFVSKLDPEMLRVLFKQRLMTIWFPTNLTPSEMNVCKNNRKFLISQKIIFEHVLSAFGFHVDPLGQAFVYQPASLNWMKEEFHPILKLMAQSVTSFAPPEYIRACYRAFRTQIKKHVQREPALEALLNSLKVAMKI